MTYPPNADAARHLAESIAADPWRAFTRALAVNMLRDIAAENDTLREAVRAHREARLPFTTEDGDSTDERLWSVLGPPPGCVRDGCENKHHARGLCHAHYETSGGAA